MWVYLGRKLNIIMLVKCAAEMVAGDHYNIRIQWKNGFHKSAQVEAALFGQSEFLKRNPLQWNDKLKKEKQKYEQGGGGAVWLVWILKRNLLQRNDTERKKKEQQYQGGGGAVWPVWILKKKSTTMK